MSCFNDVNADVSACLIELIRIMIHFTYILLNPVYTSAFTCFMLFQGRFRIDLSGTGIKVAETTSWVSQGNYAAADIQKSQVRTVSLHHLNDKASDKPLKMEKNVLGIFCLFVFLEKIRHKT